jgi:hypothetical protein
MGYPRDCRRFDICIETPSQFAGMAGDDERKGRGDGDRDSVPPPAATPRETRTPLEKVLPELLKRGLSAGESIFPKELASNIASQLVDARHGLVNAIANEVGRFLRQADIASEVRKVLAGLNVEAQIKLRFSEDENGKVRSKVSIEPPAGSRRSSKPPPNTK